VLYYHGCQKKKHTLTELAALKENKRKKTEKIHKLHNYTLTKNSKIVLTS